MCEETNRTNAAENLSAHKRNKIFQSKSIA